MKHVGSFKATSIAVIAGAVILLSTSLLNLDLFELVVGYLESIEAYELDEVALALVLICLGLLIDLLGNKRQKDKRIEVQEQRLKVLKATMITVHDIVDNFLNNLQLFRIEAEESNGLSPESLELMDDIIQETSAKLKALGDLDATPEKQMAGGMIGIDYEQSLSANEGTQQGAATDADKPHG